MKRLDTKQAIDTPIPGKLDKLTFDDGQIWFPPDEVEPSVTKKPKAR